MKKCKRIVCILLSVLMIAGLLNAASITALAAKSDLVPTGLCLTDADSEVITVVDFESGARYTADGTVDLAATEQNAIIESIESFEVRYEDKPIITIEPRDITATSSEQEMCNGYYAITFTIPETTKECFLTGLTAQNAAQTQEKLIEHYRDENNFSLEDLDYIDTEKLQEVDGDNELCWAATASNMLHYSGWGKQAGFDTEDDIFEVFVNAVEDKPGDPASGIDWFFTGISDFGLKDIEPFSGYFPEYDVDRLLGPVSEDLRGACHMMSRLIAYLKESYAVGLSLSWGDGTGHIVTAWGAVTDSAYGEDEFEHYDSIIISNSDNNQPDGTERRVAPNTLDLYKLEEWQDEYDERVFYIEMGASSGIVTGFCILKPYDDSIPKETNPKATLDRINDPDLVVNSLLFSSYPTAAAGYGATIAEGKAYMIVRVYNKGNGTADGKIKLDAVIKDANGGDVMNLSEYQDITVERDETQDLIIELPEPLQKGSYTAEITINADGALPEALLINNHQSAAFKVEGSLPDVSSVTITAELSDYVDGEITAVFDYHGLENTELFQSCDDVALMCEYYKDGKWGNGERIAAMPGQLPVNSAIRFAADQVRFLLLFYKDGMAAMAESPAYPVNIPYVLITCTDQNVDRPTMIASNATSLADGEQFSFTIANKSTGEIGALDIVYEVIGTNYVTDEQFNLTEPKQITLEQGETSAEITISSWPYSKDLHGVYRIDVQYTVTNIKNMDNLVTIARLSAPEKQSAVVTIKNDIVDPTDNRTSMREAAAYCESSGETLRFAPDVTQAILNEPITVTGSLSIDGAFDNGSGENYVILSGSEGIFSVTETGKLTVRHIKPDMYSDDNRTCAITLSGGKAEISDSSFSYIFALAEGCLINAKGGTLALKNCTFNSCTAKGSAVCIDGGAQAEMLNCMFCGINFDSEVVLNKKGDLNLINCMFVNTNSDNKSAVIVRADAKTTIVNSVLLGNTAYKDVVGSAQLYAVAYRAVGEGVTCDDNSGVYQVKEIFETFDDSDDPYIKRDMVERFSYPQLVAGAMNGCYVSEQNGVLCLSKDGENFTSIGVNTAFTAEELARDITGRERRAIFGPYCLLGGERLLGDADCDGEVTILDATAIQRKLADLPVYDIDETAADTDENGALEIVDATYIQRFLVGLPLNDRIGNLIIA